MRWPLKSPMRRGVSFKYLSHLEALTSALTLQVKLKHWTFIHPTFLCILLWRGQKHRLRIKKGDGGDRKKEKSSMHPPPTQRLPSLKQNSVWERKVTTFMNTTQVFIHRWMDKAVWYIYSMEYHTAIKKNELCHLRQHGWTQKILC